MISKAEIYWEVRFPELEAVKSMTREQFGENRRVTLFDS